MTVRKSDVPAWVFAVAESIMQKVKEIDAETYSHCVRVGKSAGLLAQAAGLSPYDTLVAEFSGLFHDIGKIAIPKEVLHKPGRLDAHEYEMVKSHPEMSVELFERLTYHPFFKDLVPGVLYHHERIDGKGYPYGLSGQEIPLSARIVSVVDTVDAMSMTRAYRKGLPIATVYEELRRCSGTQFDTDLVKIFLEVHPTWMWRTAADQGNSAPRAA